MFLINFHMLSIVGQTVYVLFPIVENNVMSVQKRLKRNEKEQTLNAYLAVTIPNVCFCTEPHCLTKLLLDTLQCCND